MPRNMVYSNTDDRVIVVRPASALPLVKLCDIDDVWLKALNKQCKLEDPNIFKFVDIMQCKQNSSEVLIIQIQSGGRLLPERRKYQN